MTLTMADHARAYRQRKAKKLERLKQLEAFAEGLADRNDSIGDDARAALEK